MHPKHMRGRAYTVVARANSLRPNTPVGVGTTSSRANPCSFTSFSACSYVQRHEHVSNTPSQRHVRLLTKHPDPPAWELALPPCVGLQGLQTTHSHLRETRETQEQRVQADLTVLQLPSLYTRAVQLRVLCVTQLHLVQVS